MNEFNFQTQRSRVASQYEALREAGRGIWGVSTKPLHSTLCVEFEVVDVDATNQFAFAVARKGQELEFFSYGQGEVVDFGALRRKATDADTNLSKAKQTNGASDFVIEGLSFAAGGHRYEDGAAGAAGTVAFPAVTDLDVIAAIAGERLLVDPGSIVLPPQAQSPFMLESAMLNGLLRSLSVQIAWDSARMEKLGHVLSLPQGGGGSQLRANGMPLASNIFRVPEGYVWARDGLEDSELVVRCRLEEAVVFPITLNDNPADGTEVIAPTKMWLDVILKAHGFEFKFPSRN